MRTRHVVWAGCLSCLLALVAGPVGAQEEWRVRFAAGDRARLSDDLDSYASEMAAAAEAMPAGDPNRPTVQYHAARAAALLGKTDQAARWLRSIWDEDVQALLISFAADDPAFDGIRDESAFDAVLALPAALSLEARALGPDVWLVEGAGANVVALIGATGVLLVDTGYGAVLPAVLRTVEGLGGGPVEALVITHAHEDHMGGAAGVGADADVYAHPGAAAAMREPYAFLEGVALPPKPPAALPDVEVGAATELAFEGTTIRLAPTPAHTTGDLSVYLVEARVAHLGDAWLASNPMMYPGTADPDGFLDRLETFLDGMHPETIVVGGHEGVGDLDAVRAQIGATRQVMAFVREAIEDGRTIEETARRGQERFPAQWVAFFYRLFTQPGG